MSPLVLSLFAVVLFNLGVFLIAYKLQTDKLTDISYSLSFIFLVFFAFTIGQGFNSEAKIVCAMILLFWAIRLGAFLLIRVSKLGKDARFDQIRTNKFRFFRFFLIQGFGSWFISIPFIIRLANNPVENQILSTLSYLEYFGWFVALFGLALESIADDQKFNFKAILGNESKLLTSGLYRKIRYPNYLGEILFWCGIFVSCIPYLTGNQWLSLAGPITIILLLVFVSGIPILEKSRGKKYAEDPNYQTYIQNSAKLLPGIY